MPTIAFTDILYVDNELIKHFKDQFAVDKTYLYYQREIARGVCAIMKSSVISMTIFTLLSTELRLHSRTNTGRSRMRALNR